MTWLMCFAYGRLELSRIPRARRTYRTSCRRPFTCELRMRQLWQHPIVQSIQLSVRVGSVIYCCYEYGFNITMCMGPSMLPTLNSSGDILLVDRLSPRIWSDYECGEIVIAKSPTKPQQTVCKRIIAKEGQRMRVQHRFDNSRDQIMEIPKGHVWLEGDNAGDSTDSRHYGPVPSALLIGRVWARIWPISQFQRFHPTTHSSASL